MVLWNNTFKKKYLCEKEKWGEDLGCYSCKYRDWSWNCKWTETDRIFTGKQTHLKLWMFTEEKLDRSGVRFEHSSLAIPDTMYEDTW